MTRTGQGEGREVAVDVLAPVAVDTAYSYRAPSEWKLEPGACVRDAARHAAGDRRRLGGRAGRRRQSQVGRGDRSTGRRSARRCAISSTGSRAGRSARAAWCSGWRSAPARSIGAAGAEIRPRRDRQGAGADDRRAGAGPGGGRGARRANGESRARGARRLLDRRHRRSGRRRRARRGRAAAGAGRGAARPGFSPAARSTPISAPRPTILAAASPTRAFSATLLEGVTGSGKTEVYFEAVAEALRQGRQGLVLAAGDRADRAIPRPVRGPLRRAAGRMALGADRAPARARLGRGGEGRSADRRRRAFGFVPAVRRPRPHRRRRGARRRLQAGGRASSTMRATWRSCARGSNRRRSCSPRPRPRSRRGSTPRPDAISWLRLPARFGEATLPDIAAVDLRREGPPRGRWLSPRAIAGVEEARSRGEQALLFLNRRGYAPLTLCRACGHRFECPNCAAWLVEHRFRAALVCHHCGHVEGAAEALPELPRGRHAHRLRAGRRAPGRGGGGSLSRHPHAGAVVGLSRRDRDPARPARRGGARRLRPHHRHATGRQGPQLPASDVRLRGRRRRRARQRRSARGRAHVPAPAPGDRAGGTRREARPGAAADLAAGSSGHRGAHFGRRRAVLRAGDRGASARRPAAVRAPGGDHRLGRGPRRGRGPRSALWRAPPMACRKAKAGGSRRSAGSRATTRSCCSARPRRRSPSCASATGSASPPRRRASADLQGFLRAMLAAAPPPRGGVKVAIDIDPQSFL